MRADWEREALAAVEEAARERFITHEQMVTTVADALEPLIRADERERRTVNNPLLLADLRAQVDALPARGVVYPYDLDSLVPEALLYRADVLALFDGGSDD